MNDFDSAIQDRSRIRRPKFGLRSLLIATALIAVVTSWYVRLVRNGQRQKKTAIELSFPYDSDRKNSPIKLEPTLPKWLQWLPSADDCQRVTTLHWYPHINHDRFFYGRKLTDLGKITDFHAVRNLYLDASRVSDHEMKTIGKLKKTERLSLWRNQFSNAGLEELRGLKNLRVLNIRDNPQINQDEFLANLRHWPNLKQLVLGANRPELDNECRETVGVTDVGLRYLLNHPFEPATSLTVIRCTSESLGLVRQLTRLKELAVEPICNPHELVRLKPLVNLKVLTIVGFKPFPIEKIQAALPNTRINFEPILRADFTDVAARWRGRIDAIEIDFVGSQARHPIQAKGYFKNSPLVRWARSDQFTEEVQTRAGKLLSGVRTATLNFNSSGLSPDIPHSKILDRFTGITSLTVTGFTPTEVMQQILASSRLRHLHLNDIARWDSFTLQKMVNLESLTIFFHLEPVGDSFFEQLHHCKNLRRVNLYTKITDRTVERFWELPNLEEVVLDSHRQILSKNAIAILCNLKQLKTCRVTGANVWSKPSPRVMFSGHLPNLTNFPGRLKQSDPNYPLYLRAFARLPN